MMIKKPRILIVEDESFTAIALQKKLESFGYDVPGVTGVGEEAVRLAALHRPDLIMMDIQLVGAMDGIMVAEAIRKQADIPIIFLTAFSDGATLQRAKITEPFGYLLKPFDDQGLQTAIEVSLYKHQMEQRLKESEAFFRLLFDMAPIGMLIGMPNGRLLSVNEAYCDILGYTAEELVGIHFREITHPEDVEMNLDFQQQVLQGKTSRYQMDKRYIHKNGRTVYASLHIAVLHDDDGQPQFFLGQVVDITQQVMAEKEKANLLVAQEESLQETEQARRLAEMLQTANMALTQTLDLDSILNTLLNYLTRLIPYDNAVVMLVMPDDQLQIRIAHDVVPTPTEHPHRFFPAPTVMKKVLAEKKSRIVDDTREQPDWEYRASSRHVRSWLAVPLVAGNVSIGLYSLTKREADAFTEENRQWAEALAAQAAVAIQNARLYESVQAQMQEVKEMQALAVQNEKMSALGRLVASLAHEINNPIQAMQGCLMLGMEKLAVADLVKAEQYLLIVQTEIERVARIIQHLRDFYRITPEQKQPTDLESTLDSVLLLAQKQLEHRSVTVERTAVARLPTLLASPDQLKQVFLNLILNAVDAMPAGGDLKLRTSLTTMSHIRELTVPAVSVIFQNSGEPIEAAALPYIFEPFFTTKKQGSGLGLSISYGIIEAHGGQITVTSEAVNGTTFTILLPVHG